MRNVCKAWNEVILNSRIWKRWCFIYKFPIDEELLKMEYNGNWIEYFVCGGKKLTFSYLIKSETQLPLNFQAGGIEWQVKSQDRIYSFMYSLFNKNYVYLSQKTYSKIPVFMDITLIYEFSEHKITKEFTLPFEDSYTEFRFPFYDNITTLNLNGRVHLSNDHKRNFIIKWPKKEIEVRSDIWSEFEKYWIEVQNRNESVESLHIQQI